VLIPRNYKLLAMLFNHFSDSGQFMVAESPIFRQRNRQQPIFRVLVTAFNVNMRRLIPFATKKEESKSAKSQHIGHKTRSLSNPLYTGELVCLATEHLHK